MLCTGIYLFAISAATASPITFHVSTSHGALNGDGLSPQTASSNLTAVLSAAQNSATVLLCNGDVFSAPAVSYTHSLSFTSAASNLTFGSFNCSSSSTPLPPPILTSAINIASAAQFITVSTPRGVNVNQWTYDLSSIVPQGHTVWSVWLDGRRHVVARFPNLVRSDALNGQDISEFLYLNTSQSYNTSTSSIILGDSAINTAANSITSSSDSYWVNATARIRETNWSYSRQVVKSYNSTTGSFTLDGRQLAFQFNGSGMFLENVYGELDNEGEVRVISFRLGRDVFKTLSP